MQDGHFSRSRNINVAHVRTSRESGMFNIMRIRRPGTGNASPTVKRVSERCPTVKRESRESCPTVKRETVRKRLIIPPQKAPVHKDGWNKPNSETGTGKEKSTLRIMSLMSQGWESCLRRVVPLLTRVGELSSQHDSLFPHKMGELFPA